MNSSFEKFEKRRRIYKSLCEQIYTKTNLDKEDKKADLKPFLLRFNKYKNFVNYIKGLSPTF